MRFREGERAKVAVTVDEHKFRGRELTIVAVGPFELGQVVKTTLMAKSVEITFPTDYVTDLKMGSERFCPRDWQLAKLEPAQEPIALTRKGLPHADEAD